MARAGEEIAHEGKGWRIMKACPHQSWTFAKTPKGIRRTCKACGHSVTEATAAEPDGSIHTYIRPSIWGRLPWKDTQKDG